MINAIYQSVRSSAKVAQRRAGRLAGSLVGNKICGATGRRKAVARHQPADTDSPGIHSVAGDIPVVVRKQRADATAPEHDAHCTANPVAAAPGIARGLRHAMLPLALAAMVAVSILGATSSLSQAQLKQRTLQTIDSPFDMRSPIMS